MKSVFFCRCMTIKIDYHSLLVIFRYAVGPSVGNILYWTRVRVRRILSPYSEGGKVGNLSMSYEQILFLNKEREYHMEIPLNDIVPMQKESSWNVSRFCHR